MCFKDRSRFSKLSLETGSLVFGIIKSIIFGLGSIASLCWFLYMIKIVIDNSKHYASNDFYLALVFSGFALLLTIYAIVAFQFSVILLHGIVKRKPRFVKAYFVYGVVATVIGFVVGILICVVNSVDFYEFLTIGLIILVLSSIYAAIIVMIWFTYKKLEREDPNAQQYELVKP